MYFTSLFLYFSWLMWTIELNVDTDFGCLGSPSILSLGGYFCHCFMSQWKECKNFLSFFPFLVKNSVWSFRLVPFNDLRFLCPLLCHAWKRWKVFFEYSYFYSNVFFFFKMTLCPFLFDYIFNCCCPFLILIWCFFPRRTKE